MATCNLKFEEKQMLGDALNSQKFIAGVYNNDVMECATPAVRNCICGILEDERRMQEEIFEEMNRRGFYPTEKAEEKKIAETKQTYGACVTV